MAHYIRDARAKTASPDRVVGAYLVKAGNPNEVDSWRACSDVEDLLKKDPQDVIYGGSLEEIESELWRRHPAVGSECTLITNRYEGRWDIERSPRLQQAGFAALQGACAMHGKVLVGSEMFNQMGGAKAFHDRGFLVQARNSRHAHLVGFNPRCVALRDWKGKVDSIRVFLQPELPPELTIELHEAVKPDNYPEKHPYAGKLSSEESVTQSQLDGDSRWGRRWRKSKDCNLDTAPETILRCVGIADRLSGRRYRHPWRRNSSWKPLLRQVVQYIHGLEDAKDGNWPRLAKWIRRQARAARVRIPPRKKVPTKPVFGKRPPPRHKQAPKRIRRRRLSLGG
jgi:hypothetical protein